MAAFHRYTLRDVAKHAGVSYQTVSRVINHHPYVAEETRVRVQEAIEALDYRPNKAAQSLAAKRSQTLAVITFGMDYYGPAQMVTNIEYAAKAAGYDLVLSIAADTSTTSMRAAINSVLHWQVDGILLLKPIRGVSYEEMVQISGGLPLVQINSQHDQIAPSLMIDQEYGTRLLLDHLFNLGHRDFCVIYGPSNYYDAIARQLACESILRDGVFVARLIGERAHPAGGPERFGGSLRRIRLVRSAPPERDGDGAARRDRAGTAADAHAPLDDVFDRVAAGSGIRPGLCVGDEIVGGHETRSVRDASTRASGRGRLNTPPIGASRR